MKTNFNDCLTRLLKDEGGYSNDPNDNGGATNFGITIADYRKYINKTGTSTDVRNMTVDQAKTIYKSKYWDALDCDNLPSGVDYTCFDYGVNSGLGRPRKALQRFKALKGTELIDAINNERMAFLQAIGVGHNAKFLKGWTARVARVRAYSKVLASKKTIPTGSGTAVVAAAGGGLIYTYWHLFLNHWVLYTLGLLITSFVIDCLIYWYRNRKTTNV